MTRWSREPYALVLACIGAALVVFVLGVSVVLAAGHSVPAALWTVGGAAVGILAGVLLPWSGSAEGTPDAPTPEDPSPSSGEGEHPLVAGSGDAPPRRTPWLVLVLATIALVGLALSGLLYGGLIHPADCELREVARTPACDGPLLNFADVLIFVAAAAGGALLGLYVRRPAPAPDLVETPTPIVDPPPPPPDEPKPDGPKPPSPTRFGLPAVLAAVVIVVVLGAVALLLSLLLRATVDGARVFNVVSLLLIVATGGLTAAAFKVPEGKRQGLVAGAVLTAVLAFVSSTASGFVVDRFTKPTAGLAPPVTVKNDFSPIVKPPSIKNYFSTKVTTPSVRVELGSECTVYLVHLDELVDDEPHIAEHLPGRSFPLDQGARACGLKRASEVNAIAAVLAAR
jgi:hypothetical protein